MQDEDTIKLRLTYLESCLEDATSLRESNRILDKIREYKWILGETEEI